MNPKGIVTVLLLFTVPTVTAEEPVRITAKSTKPMKDICEGILNLFHWRITYEDAPVFDKREVVLSTAPSGVPWLRMRAVPVEFDIPAMVDESIGDYRRKVMDAAMSAYNRSGNRAAFSYSDNGDYIHVVPSSVAGRDGRMRPSSSILDVPVTVKLGQYTIRGIVEAILEQVGHRAGTNISLGTIPNSFKQIVLTEEANDESARDIFVRVFDRQNGARYMAGLLPERLYWELTYVADGSGYFFNVGVVPEEFGAGTVLEKSRHVDVPAATQRSPGDSGGKAGFIVTPGTAVDRPKQK